MCWDCFVSSEMIELQEKMMDEYEQNREQDEIDIYFDEAIRLEEMIEAELWELEIQRDENQTNMMENEIQYLVSMYISSGEKPSIQ